MLHPSILSILLSSFQIVFLTISDDIVSLVAHMDWTQISREDEHPSNRPQFFFFFFSSPQQNLEYILPSEESISPKSYESNEEPFPTENYYKERIPIQKNAQFQEGKRNRSTYAVTLIDICFLINS